MRLALKLSDIEHRELVTAGNARGTTTRIPRLLLFRLLRDHAAALAALQEVHIDVTTPKE